MKPNTTQVLQPIMTVEITVPEEHQGNVIGEVNRRKGLILDSETKEGYTLITAEVPLNDMFGFSATLRASTQVSAFVAWFSLV